MKCDDAFPMLSAMLSKENYDYAISEMNKMKAEQEKDNKVKLNEEKSKELVKLSKPIIKFLNDNYHPHVCVLIDCGSVEFLEGIHTFRTSEFYKD